MTIKEQLQQWQHKIDALNQRERILVLSTTVVIALFLLQLILLDPLLATQKKLQRDISSRADIVNDQQNDTVIITAQLAAGINRKKLEKLEQLHIEVEALNQQIEDSVVAMIPPRMMPEVLEQILSNTKGLKLVSLENKPVVAILDVSDPENVLTKVNSHKKSRAMEQKNGAQPGLYNHGFVLTLRGDYMAAIQYFEALSKLPWRFYWDTMHYQVDQYPQATLRLEVHTVSMSEEWIGV